jgi:hypothetical protein
MYGKAFSPERYILINFAFHPPEKKALQYSQNRHTDTLYPGDTTGLSGFGNAGHDSLLPPSRFLQTENFMKEPVGTPLTNQIQPLWIPLVLFACLVLLAWTRLFFRRRLAMVFSAVAAKNYANQLIRDGNLFNERIGLVLFPVYVAVLSLFILLSLPLLNLSRDYGSRSTNYLFIAGGVLGLWFLKVIVVRLLAALFNTREHSRELLINMYLFNIFAGMILLPIVCCMAFSDTRIFFFSGLVILTLVYMMRLVRMWLIGFGLGKFSGFHLFFYLCTLEILPMIVLAKILTGIMIPPGV